MKFAATYAVMLTILFFFVLKKAEKPLILLVPIYIALNVLLFQYSLLGIRAKIKKREHEIDKEAVFIGRYLLVKLYSGRPLLNALMEISKSQGLASKYIKEIVDDIDTGKPIEAALNDAIIYSPSEKIGKILFHITNALQLGIDIAGPLESVLQEITKQEELEINKYGRKLNSLVIFYMLVAIIVPSLGTAMFIVLSSFLSLPIDLPKLMVVVFFIAVLQFIFITLFKGVRPTVNL